MKLSLVHQSLETRTWSVCVLRYRYIDSRFSVTVDYAGRQTLYKIRVGRNRILYLIVSHRNRLYRWFNYLHGEGCQAQVEQYWETNNGSVFETKAEYRRFLRSVYRSAVMRAIWHRLHDAVVCRVKGHDWDSVADPENGTEDVWCRRCGFGHHVQF